MPAQWTKYGPWTFKHGFIFNAERHGWIIRHQDFGTQEWVFPDDQVNNSDHPAAVAVQQYIRQRETNQTQDAMVKAVTQLMIQEAARCKVSYIAPRGMTIERFYKNLATTVVEHIMKEEA